MRNLLREELFKSRKGVTTYICAGWCVFSLIVSLFTISNVDLPLHESWQDFQCRMPLFFDASLLSVIFAAVFVAAEFSGGTIKNYVALGIDRNKVYFTKLIKVLGTVLAIVFLCQILSLTVTPFILESGNSLGGKGALLYFYGLLIIIQQACFYTFLAFWLRNAVGVIGLYFGIMVFEEVLLVCLNLADGIFADFLVEALTYSTYMQQVNYISTAITEMNPLKVVLALIIPLVISGVSICLGMLTFNKRDIK